MPGQLHPDVGTEIQSAYYQDPSLIERKTKKRIFHASLKLLNITLNDVIHYIFILIIGSLEFQQNSSAYKDFLLPILLLNLIVKTSLQFLHYEFFINYFFLLSMKNMTLLRRFYQKTCFLGAAWSIFCVITIVLGNALNLNLIFLDENTSRKISYYSLIMLPGLLSYSIRIPTQMICSQHYNNFQGLFSLINLLVSLTTIAALSAIGLSSTSLVAISTSLSECILVVTLFVLSISVRTINPKLLALMDDFYDVKEFVQYLLQKRAIRLIDRALIEFYFLIAIYMTSVDLRNLFYFRSYLLIGFTLTSCIWLGEKAYIWDGVVEGNDAKAKNYSETGFNYLIQTLIVFISFWLLTSWPGLLGTADMIKSHSFYRHIVIALLIYLCEYWNNILPTIHNNNSTFTIIILATHLFGQILGVLLGWMLGLHGKDYVFLGLFITKLANYVFLRKVLYKMDWWKYVKQGNLALQKKKHNEYF